MEESNTLLFRMLTTFYHSLSTWYIHSNPHGFSGLYFFFLFPLFCIMGLWHMQEKGRNYFALSCIYIPSLFYTLWHCCARVRVITHLYGCLHGNRCNHVYCHGKDTNKAITTWVEKWYKPFQKFEQILCGMKQNTPWKLEFN